MRAGFPSIWVIGVVVTLGLVAPTWADAVVSTEDGQVVADGDFVRIETDDEEAVVDWRRGEVRVRDEDDDEVLVELGAVRAADHIKVALEGDVLFEFGSAAITEAAAETLSRVAEVVRRHAKGDVLVVGHTDSVGDEATNQALSEQRALSVIRWLHGHEGIPAGMLVGRGMGESQPVAHNATPDGRDDPSGRAKNRRVELFVATTEQADVKEIAGLVTIGEDTVDVGDVHVEDEEVRVGGLTITGAGVTGIPAATGGAATGGSTTCAAGKTCRADCPEGGCRMTCPAGAICTYGCSGGDCEMACSAGATCELSCDGGDCRFSKALGSNCETTCRGGGCSG